jgi:hypothetical protein
MEEISQEAWLQAVKESNETPCMKCLQAAQAAHIMCLANAKTPAEKAACNNALSAAIKACPCP